MMQTKVLFQFCKLPTYIYMSEWKCKTCLSIWTSWWEVHKGNKFQSSMNENADFFLPFVWPYFLIWVLAHSYDLRVRKKSMNHNLPISYHIKMPCAKKGCFWSVHYMKNEVNEKSQKEKTILKLCSLSGKHKVERGWTRQWGMWGKYKANTV